MSSIIWCNIAGGGGEGGGGWGEPHPVNYLFAESYAIITWMCFPNSPKFVCQPLQLNFIESIWPKENVACVAVVACSQILYFLLKAHPARVIKYKAQGGRGRCRASRSPIIEKKNKAASVYRLSQM